MVDPARTRRPGLGEQEPGEAGPPGPQEASGVTLVAPWEEERTWTPQDSFCIGRPTGAFPAWSLSPRSFDGTQALVDTALFACRALRRSRGLGASGERFILGTESHRIAERIEDAERPSSEHNEIATELGCRHATTRANPQALVTRGTPMRAVGHSIYRRFQREFLDEQQSPLRQQLAHSSRRELRRREFLHEAGARR